MRRGTKGRRVKRQRDAGSAAVASGGEGREHEGGRYQEEIKKGRRQGYARRRDEGGKDRGNAG